MRNETEVKKKSETSSDTSQNDQYAGKDVEPDIFNCTNIPSYDLKLFQEAQAVASEKIVSIYSLFCILISLIMKYFLNNITLPIYFQVLRGRYIPTI